MIGKTISHYKILEKIGEGGMGVVFKAEDTKLDRLVALKFLPRQYSINKEEKQRFIHEAKAAAALDHTNICAIYEIDETEDGQMFIVMAYYDGETLKDKITSGPLPIAEAINITIQVTEGLNKAHTKNIIHRDIKAANIIITSDGIAKIVDFGLAKLKGQTKLTKEGSTLGTVSYMSPEQVLGEEVNHQTDVWSLGVVLYEMTIGQFPFKGEHEQAVMYSIINEEPEQIAGIRPEVPEKLEQIIFKALEKEQNNRYQNVKELFTDLRSLAKGVDSAISIEEQFQPPPFLEAEDHEDIEPPVFVAREQELEKLNKFLDRTIEGKGQVVFVKGEAGSGKTALVHEFARRAQEIHSDLIVATGKCNATTGVVDPYLPFLEIMNMLTGDVKEKWITGKITREHVIGLWNLLPLSIQALVDNGPDLINIFVQGGNLLKRLEVFSPGRTSWKVKLKKLVEHKAALPPDPNLQQSYLLRQFTRVLIALSREQPLLLILDDLHWADSGSINLLLKLGQSVEGSRILLTGTYRGAEVAMGRENKPHPLEPLINEFKRNFGEFEIDLGKTEDREFLNSFLDTEPNELSQNFKDTLYKQTKGHSLFTVELLRSMQESEMLVKDKDGNWIEGPELNWETMPARVDAVIGERINRLSDTLREILTIACVEGEEFTAEVVARLKDTEVRELVRLLSSDLDRHHHLVSSQGIRRIQKLRLSLYRFRHILFQRYLYNSLDETEQVFLHEDVGKMLETLYGERAEKISVQLAYHFQKAGITEKAIEYLKKAGDRSLGLYANEEAILHFTKGLELLKTLPDSPERTQLELTLQLALTPALQFTRGLGAAELEQTLARAKELCQQLGETPQLLIALVQLSFFHAVRGDYRKALEYGKQVKRMTEQGDDPVFTAFSNVIHVWPLLNVADLNQSLTCAQQVISFYDPKKHGSLLFTTGIDMAIISYGFGAWGFWIQGHPDRAREWCKKAMALARELAEPYNLAFAYLQASETYLFLKQAQMVKKYAEKMAPIAIEKGFGYLEAHVIFYRGWLQTLKGHTKEGIGQMNHGLRMMLATNTETCFTRLYAWMASVCLEVGQIEDGLTAITKAMEVMRNKDEIYIEAELYRLKGELLLMKAQGKDEAEVRVCFQKAINVARHQKAKSWELRAVMSLSRLLQKKGKKAEARKILAEIYGWFTEGFDTLDLKEAKALLEDLSG